jgi:hypothetical protein
VTSRGLGVSIDFRENDGVYTGSGSSGRRWRITRAFTGWRLEFIDPGDSVPTYAGVHVSVAAAQAEANTPPTMRRRR